MKHRTIHSKPWWRVPLLLLLCLIGGSSPMWADTREFKSATESNTVVHMPTLAEPYLAFTVMYYDATDGHNGFFMHQSPSGVPSGVTAGPALFVDGQYICTPDYQLAWPGSGSGNSSGATNACSDDDWWGDTYTKTVDGVTYTVKFYNPYNESSVISGSKRKVVTCLIFMDNFQLGKTYSVKIAGYWKINNTHDPQEQSFTWSFTGTMGNRSLSASMTAIGQMALSGNLIQNYGPTVVGSYNGATTANLTWKPASALTSKESYSSDKVSFSGQAVSFTERTNYYNNADKYIEYIIPINGFTPTGYKAMSPTIDVNVYEWFKVSVPGYIRAKGKPTLTVSNKWNKQVKLTWTQEGNNTGGTWSIYRYKTSSGATSRERIVEALRNNTTSCVVEAPTYDERYTYEVSFIPTNGDRRDELTSSDTITVKRDWSVKIDSVKVYDDSKLRVKWSHNSIEDAGSKTYQLVLQRSENKTSWTDVKTVSITSKNTVDGEYVDASGLTANRTYYYRLKITVMDKEYTTDPVGTKLGGSKILSFSATRGSYSNMVKLQWQVKQVGTNQTNFIIQRRPLGSNDDSAWADIYATSGTASGYSYDDVTALPGSFNEYKVVVWSQDGNVRTFDDEMKTDGFSLTTGMISGNISFGTGTAVDSVKVTLKQQTVDGDITSGMRSVKLSGTGQGFRYDCDTTALKTLFGGDFSIQMYINPDSTIMNGDKRYQLLDVQNSLTFFLSYDKTNKVYHPGIYLQGTDYHTSLNIYPDKWMNIACVHRKGIGTTIYLTQGDSIQSEVVKYSGSVVTIDPVIASVATCISYGNNATYNGKEYYNGYLDEFRFFTRALTEGDILRNYNHPLAGNETGLAIYYPFDEGLAEQSLAYDFSRTNGVSNGRHATAKVAAASQTYIPSEDQMSLMAYTDVNGYYEVRGVPFSGEGTSYAVIPTLGIHEFSPTMRSRYVSMSTLNHSGVDFEDVSSFPVSGKIFYAGTDYPVEGVSLAVDGIDCAKDGAPVVTNENGEFEISVPIGDHFISVSKANHVFADGGRYPADPNSVGTRYTFSNGMKNLTFTDETLVNFSGRVVGGDIEGDKTIGFGQSHNNIGVAEIVLTPQNPNPRMNVVPLREETTLSYETNTDTVTIASASPKVGSSAWRGAGSDDCSKLFIHTDPATGEFSALVPPVQYKMISMTVPSNADINFGSLPTIDMSNVGVQYTDTLYSESGTAETFTYNYQLRQTYHSTPTFNVAQSDHQDGAFGISSYKMIDLEGGIDIDDIYTVDASGKVVYNYGGAVFEMSEPYTFNLEAYEEYVNNDGTTPVTERVPLKDVVVTIDNALSDDQPIYIEDGTVNGNDVKAGEVAQLQENQLQLDSLGQAVYTWKAGLPNISVPYTRTIAMSYEIGGRHQQWSGLTGIVLGSMPTGNNFVTSGPDMIDMVLRDPPGTCSSAEWSSGTVTSHSTSNLGNWSSENHVTTTSKLGVDFSTIAGALPGVAVLNDAKSISDLEVGVMINVEGEAGNTWSRTVEATKTITTSDAMEYVGAQGDVFVGTSTNIIFGKARNLGFYRKGTSGEAELRLEDVVTTGMDFGTEFVYTQNYIENVLIPNLEAMRNSMLQTVSDVNAHSCTGDRPIYLTTRQPGDEGYGENNPPNVYDCHTEWIDIHYEEPCSDGPSYKMVVPNENESYQDSVYWCNSQIETWKRHLAANEAEKVRAYELRSVKDSVDYKNFSFDSGTSITNTVETEETRGYKYDIQFAAGVHLNRTWGIEIKKTGVIFDVGTETTAGYHREDETSTSQKTTFSYTLKEEGDDDALTVDVYKYGAYSPIFRTRGGQTSAPYEGQVVTKYYKPGTVIQEATMQIEVPQIAVDAPIVSDVPTGGTANYTLRLSNASEIDEDVYYRLLVDDETNPNGANIMIDGKPVTDSRIIKIPAGQTVTKALQLKQTNTSILEYKNIGIVLASQSQYDPTSTWDVIADTVFISAYFVPSSSEVDLALSNTLMNTQTGTDLRLTFSGFDRNYHGLKAFRLQYKHQGSADWTQLYEYVTDSAAVTPNNQLLPKTGASVSYVLPMQSFADGSYLFRVASVATYGTDEVYRYSQEIALTKDMARPRPLGQPEPADGVLDIGDELSVTFNEAFLKGELTMEKNFRVTGVLNGTTVDHETALSMQNTETTAQTEASIALDGKPFSFDAWVNLSGQGILLSHGAGNQKFTVGTDATNHLVVTIADSTYTSKATMPTGKWAFLTLSYQPTDTGGELSATVATDAEETELFSGEPTKRYEGNGPLAVGKNLTGAIHELLLWDEAHDKTTALLNRSVTKNPSTRHLIGYWKMNEGEGKQIRDYARNRHLTMPQETWYINNVNKAVALDGASYLTVPTADLPIYSDDDYAVEFWMKGNTQTGDVQLLQMGDVALSLAADGALQLTGKDAFKPAGQTTPMATTSGNVLDNVWHHVALNVLRQGAVAIYVDGQRVLSTNAANVGSINSDRLIIGAKRTTFSAENAEYSFDRAFKGQIDEVRIWSATINADQLTANRKVRLTGSEDGLALYFPFEKKQLDSGNQVETVGSNLDLVYGDDSHSAQLNSLTSSTSQLLNYTDEAPALRTKPTETNVSFKFTASDTKVVIELDEDATAIEGTTLHFTVRDVRDENGNYSEPVTWSAFVNQKELVWQEDNVSCEVGATSSTTMTATIVNKGGTQQMWTLSGMPSWLQADSEYGTTNPRSQSTVTFSVSQSTPIGKYEETVYLKGNNGIETPLTISVKVTGDEPLWAVNTGDFEESMNIIANLEVLGRLSEDEDDVVGAFINGECRGVASPEYKQRYDSFFLTMDIYGNGSDSNEPIEFKVYDASTGIIYPVVKAYANGETTPTTVAFTPNDLLGRYNSPMLLAATDEIEQNIELGAGWNWMSLNVQPDDFSVDNVMAKAADRAATVKAKSGYSEYIAEEGYWDGSLSTMNNLEMYAVQTHNAFTLSVTGHRVNPAETVITAKKGWNWIGFTPQQIMSVDDALAGLQPVDDDIIKGQRGVAYFDDYEWSGSLTTLVPGKGYKLYNNTEGNRQFTYPSAATTSSANHAPAALTLPTTTFTPVDYHLYPDNMVLFAQVVSAGMPLTGAELGVFAGEQCREAAITDERGRVAITIPGDKAVKLTFRVALDGMVYTVAQTVSYQTDAICGRPKEPLVIDISTATEIWNIGDDRVDDSGKVYDLQGRLVSIDSDQPDLRLKKGVYIINGKKQVNK